MSRLSRAIPPALPLGGRVLWRLLKGNQTAVAVVRDVPTMGRELRVTVQDRLYWSAVYPQGGALEPMAAQHRSDFERLGWRAAPTAWRYLADTIADLRTIIARAKGSLTLRAAERSNAMRP